MQLPAEPSCWGGMHSTVVVAHAQGFIVGLLHMHMHLAGYHCWWHSLRCSGLLT